MVNKVKISLPSLLAIIAKNCLHQKKESLIVWPVCNLYYASCQTVEGVLIWSNLAVMISGFLRPRFCISEKRWVNPTYSYSYPDLLSFFVGLRQRFPVAVNQRIHHAEVDTHVSKTLAAGGTSVIVACVLCKTVRVHEMSTGQFLHTEPSFGRRC